MGYTAELKTLPKCTVYYKQGVIGSFAQIEKFILESLDECKLANPKIVCRRDSYCYTAYLDNEFRESDLLIEYGQQVDRIGVETKTIKFRKLAETPAVCVRHKGDYAGIKAAYEFAMSWVKDLGFEISAPPREQYIHGVWDTNNSENWIIEIQIPVNIQEV